MKKFISGNVIYVALSEEEVKQIISEKTGVPVDKITAGGCQLEIELKKEKK